VPRSQPERNGENKYNTCLYQESNPGHPAHIVVTILSFATGTYLKPTYLCNKYVVGNEVKVKVNVNVLFFFLNGAQRHESILGEWRYSSTHY
jgi:hypothetical protein